MKLNNFNLRMKISLEISCSRCVNMQSDSAQMKENRFYFYWNSQLRKQRSFEGQLSNSVFVVTDKFQVESDTVVMSEMRNYPPAEDIETLAFMNVFLMYFHWNAFWSIATEV